ncbi:acyltransferase family protein [Glycomyces endophyticus]
MTSPQPPRPQTRAATGGGVNEETLHLPSTTPGAASSSAAAAQTQRTAPSPYPVRPPFRAPAPPPPTSPAPPGIRTTGAHPRPAPAPAPAPVRPPQRWEGVGFRPDIQGLRAVAVALVVLSHIGLPFAAGGYVGVDVFFVVSGFLITSLLVKEAFDTGKISLAGFYARRARRILPAATVVTIATVVGAWLWFPVTRLEDVMQDAFTVIVYVVNYRFIAEQTEYLNADQMPSPFQQYWSLAVEEQFYVVWPLLLIGLLLLIKRDLRKLVGAAAAACAGIFALSFVLSVMITEVSQPAAYYAAHTRAWELAAGALLALSLPTLKKTPKGLAWVLGIAGLAAIIASGVLYSDTTPFPGYTALLPVLGTMMVIAAGTGAGANPVTSLLSTGPFQFLGKISYSLYLWHWPILILIPLAVGAEPSILLGTVLVACAVAVSQLTYQYVEEPLRNARPLKTNNVWGLVTGVACSLMGIAMVLTMTVGFGKVPEDEEPVDLDAVEEVEDGSEIEAKLRDAVAATTAPEELSPSLASVGEDKPVIYDDGCHLEFEQTEWPEDCVYGDPNGAQTMVLVGDSHAAQWFPAFEAIASDNGWKLVTRTKSSCTPVSVRVDNTNLGREYTECEEAREDVFDEIDQMQPAMVILVSYESIDLSGVEPDETTGPWLDGWTETIERVQGSAERVVAIADTPWADGPVPDCVASHEDSLQECNIDQAEGVRLPERRAEAMELQRGLGVTVVDPLEWFCYEEVCPAVVDGMLVFRDGHHVSTPYMRSLAGLLAAELPL